MQTETKCPKCGAEVMTDEFGVVDYKCESWANTPKNTFEQSEKCTLRAALSKAKVWMEHSNACKMQRAHLGGECTCGLSGFLSTLTRAENGDL